MDGFNNLKVYLLILLVICKCDQSKIPVSQRWEWRCCFVPLELAAFLSFIIGVAKGILPADFSNSEVAEIMTSYDLSYYEGSKRNKEAALYHCSSALWTDECEEGAAARDASTGALALVALALVASALAPR